MINEKANTMSGLVSACQLHNCWVTFLSWPFSSGLRGGVLSVEWPPLTRPFSWCSVAKSLLTVVEVVVVELDTGSLSQNVGLVVVELDKWLNKRMLINDLWCWWRCCSGGGGCCNWLMVALAPPYMAQLIDSPTDQANRVPGTDAMERVHWIT